MTISGHKSVEKYSERLLECGVSTETTRSQRQLNEAEKRGEEN